MTTYKALSNTDLDHPKRLRDKCLGYFNKKNAFTYIQMLLYIICVLCTVLMCFYENYQFLTDIEPKSKSPMLTIIWIFLKSSF